LSSRANETAATSPQGAAEGAADGDYAFIHIPKTGGTGIEHLGKRQGFRWGIERPRDSWPVERPYGIKCVPHHIPRGLWLAKGQDPYAGTTTFCAVRHPYTRFVSQFVWNVSLKAGCAYPLEPRACRERAAPFCTAEKLNAFANDTVGAARRSLLAVSEPGQGEPPDALALQGDCHFLPQWLYTTPPCGHLLRYESLAQDFRTAFAASPRLAEVDLTAAKSNAAPCEMRVGDLSDESRALLAEVYARDFRTFGYDPEMASSFSRRRRRSRRAAALVQDEALVSVSEEELVS
jgi:hypothetical protein